MGITESYKSMAKRFGISKTEAAKRIRNLERMGYVTVVRRRGEPNEYYVHFFPNAIERGAC